MCLNETYSEVWTYQHLSDTLPIKNDLKWGDPLSQFLFKFALNMPL
jgi:hypothetical protein